MGLCGNIDGCTTNVKSQNTYVGSPQTNYFLYLSKKILQFDRLLFLNKLRRNI